MGNYLYLGIRTKAYSDISDIKRYKGAVDTYIEELNNRFDKSIYDMEISEDSISIALKEEYRSLETMKKFLLEEFDKLNSDNELTKDKVEELKKASTEKEMLEALRMGKDVTRSYIYLENVSFRPTGMYQVETMAFLNAGKFFLEEYGDLSRYIIKVLRNSSDNPLIKSLGFYEY